MKNILFILSLICIIYIAPSTAYSKAGLFRTMVYEKASTQITFGWSQLSGDNPTLLLSTKQNFTDPTTYALSDFRKTSIKGLNNYFITLKSLTPNTTYYLKIIDSEGDNRVLHFNTLPEDTQSLSIIAGGDSRNNRDVRQNANRLVALLAPHFVMFGGDMTQSGTDNQWKEWLEDWQLTISKSGRITPLVPARGNHERTNEEVALLFDVPASNIYYKVMLGNNFLSAYTLNTEISIAGDQSIWLKETLAKDLSKWKIAQYHKPMRPHVSRKKEGNNQYEHWAHLFQEHKINLVVECDAHTVKTTWPIVLSTAKEATEGFIRNDKEGIVYVGEGCWGAPLRGNDDIKPWTRDSGSFNQFKWIWILDNKIEVRTVKVEQTTQKTGLKYGTMTEPTWLKIWNPTNGKVITIH